jgi:hypothetical protein
MSRGVLTDIANARADVRYDGIATRYVQDFGRWNIKEVIDLGQSFNYDPGYTEGKSAGALEIIGLRASVVQADIQGRTVVGEVQRDLGIMPAGARLTVGNDPALNPLPGTDIEFKLNQLVELSSSGALLPAGFKFGDALSSDLINTLSLNPALLGKDKVANLGISVTERWRYARLYVPRRGVAIMAKGASVGMISGPQAARLCSMRMRATLPELPDRPSTPLNVVGRWSNAVGARGLQRLRSVPAVRARSRWCMAVNHAYRSGQCCAGTKHAAGCHRRRRLKVDGRGSVIAGNGGEIGLSGNAVWCHWGRHAWLRHRQRWHADRFQ